LCGILEDESKHKLEFESYTDEVHAFFRQNDGRRKRYANLQYEGPTEEILLMELSHARERGDLDRVQEIEFELEELE
jgi:hypothetical protein